MTEDTREPAAVFNAVSDSEQKRGPGRPSTHGPRAHITMNWDLEMIEAVRQRTKLSGLSRDEIVHRALRAYLANPIPE